MKKFIFILAVLSACSKNEADIIPDQPANTNPGIRFLANDIEWRSGVNPGDPITTATIGDFNYYAQMAGANEFYISGYGSVDSVTSRFEKFAIYLPDYKGPGSYSISGGGNKAEFLTAIVSANQSESFYNTDDPANFLVVDSIVDSKVYGRFAFTAKSENNMLKITEGSFREVPIW